jgi:hypothetical protein
VTGGRTGGLTSIAQASTTTAKGRAKSRKDNKAPAHLFKEQEDN